MKPPRFVRSLSKAEQEELEQLALHGSNGRIRRRANAIRLSGRSYTVAQLGEILGATRQSIPNWFDAFEAGGAAALADKPRSGAPPKATATYRAQLLQAVQQNPRDLGYPFTVWTLLRLRAHLARVTSVLLGEARVRQLLQAAGWVWKRPKHTLKAKRDPQAFAQVKKHLDALKKNPWNPTRPSIFSTSMKPKSICLRS